MIAILAIYRIQENVLTNQHTQTQSVGVSTSPHKSTTPTQASGYVVLIR